MPVNTTGQTPNHGEKSRNTEGVPFTATRAWLQVVGSFLLYFNSWGTVNTFGAFQTYYENNPDWSSSASNISWIGSVQACLLLFIGIITGPIFDAGHFRLLVITGAVLIPFGFMMTSLSHTYWQVMLAQGVTIGIGNGCLYVASIAILPQYFTTNKAFASGIAASGSSIGGIVYPIVFRQIEQSVTFAWATRVLGLISLVTLWSAVLLMRPRIPAGARRVLLDLSAFKHVSYTTLCIAMFSAFMAFYGPIFYIESYALQEHIVSESFSFYLLPILNAASVPGRILPNLLADRLGAINTLIPCSLAAAILALSWIAIHSGPGLIVFAVLYGFFSGALVSLAPMAVLGVSPDPETMGTRIGQCFFFAAFGLLIGSPICGVLLNATHGWLGLQLFSGLGILLTALLLVWSCVARRREICGR